MCVTTLTLRDARESDLPDVLAMIRELAAFENLESELQVTASNLREALFGANSVAKAVIALEGGETVGYAIYYKTFSSFTGATGLFLEDIFVRSAWRKKGIGRALLERVGQVAASLHCKRFEWIALRWNENALNFYDSLGAKALDEWVQLRMNQAAIKELVNRKTTAVNVLRG